MSEILPIELSIELQDLLKTIYPLKALYGDFLIDHTDYANYKYNEVIEKYIGKSRFDESPPYLFSDKVGQLIALRDSNGLLPPDLQALFNEWILSTRL